jgi:hypothetical protein
VDKVLAEILHTNMEGTKITTFSVEYFVKTTLQAETLPPQIASAVYNCQKIQEA